LADQPRDVPTQRIARLDAPVRVAKKPHVSHAEHGGRGLLFGSADVWDRRSGHLRIEAAGVPVAEYAVGDVDAGTGPAGDGSTGPEIGVVWVGNDNQSTLNVIVGKNHDHSRQMAFIREPA
jgi:hypothetical protein